VLLTLCDIVEFFLAVEDEPEKAFPLGAGDILHGRFIAFTSECI
jgi:hypothetical protein